MSSIQPSADLKKFLVKEVASICDADPEVLAQYIIALISTGESPEVLQASLEEKLKEFFDNRRLFTKLEDDKTKTDTATESSRSERREALTSRRYSDYTDDEDDGDRNFKHRRQRSEREDTRSSRHMEEHGKRRYPDNNQHTGPSKHFRGEDYNTRNPNTVPLGPAAMYNNNGQALYDARNRGRGRGGRARGTMMQSRGQQMRPRCRDYNGSAPFANTGAPMNMGARGPQPPFFGMPVPNNVGPDAYDPERATLIPTSFPVDMPGMMMPDALPNAMSVPMRGAMRPRGTRGRGRGGYSSGAPYHQNKANTTLVIENIPADVCQISKINDFFKKFGTIVNISVQPHAQKAILQFSNRAEAEAAHGSPDPIFDNRFVKVYFQKEKEEPTEAEPEAKPATTTPTPTTNEPDPELVAARAAELAKQREEKQKLRQEHMKAILELQKQKEQLLQRQIDEQKKLMEKLSNSKNMSQSEKEELLKSLKKIAADITASKVDAKVSAGETESMEAGNTESSEELKKKLAKLEAEASALGITDTYAPYGSGFRGARGGFYGRGRGYPRMRGGLNRFSLDNRPTSILVKDIPQGAEQELRKHFENFGNISSYETQDSSIVVRYSQRFEAEKAISAGAEFNKGTLQLAWYTAPAGSSTETPAETNQEGTDQTASVSSTTAETKA
ncbi:hypothetical protein EC973_007149 [Apophysomyces ossiformis]|uniref:RRM domain-containing protein n=1 Tax=Apophysomyces ossiformis TaxID=679940 RepID=A0A8H7BVS1_9FUNG|nr:hypothetical protein EC973_007149 [Apophysomyces ossiformis]